MTETLTTNTTRRGDGFAITSLVLGCCGVLLFWLWAVVPILAIIFGGVAMNQAKQSGHKPNGMAVAGLTLGIIESAIFLLIILAAVAGS